MSVEQDLFLGIDLGTQGMKGLVLDSRRQEVVARAHVNYGLRPSDDPRVAEQDPGVWAEALRSVVDELFSDPSLDVNRCAGLSIAGQQHGFVALDAQDEVICPAKLWCDTSTEDQASELSRAWGRHLPVGYTASKILALKQRSPDQFSRLHKVLLPHDWLNMKLTGVSAMEFGDASGTGLFDPVSRKFREDWMSAIDDELASKMPPLLAPGETLGTVSEDAARRFGLPAGLRVGTGSGDNMMSAIGAGATRAGVVVLSLGTSATIFTRHDHDCASSNSGGLIADFCDATGGWLPLLCIMNATSVTETLRALVQSDDEISYAGLSVEAAKVAPGSEGLLLMPFFQGERVPNLPSAQGSLWGINNKNLRPATLFRAGLEGISLNLAWGLELLKTSGLRIQELRVVGGGAKNPLWLQIIADILGHPIQTLEETESAALGAAIHAWWTTERATGGNRTCDDLAQLVVKTAGGQIETNEGLAAAYAPLVERYRQTLEKTYLRDESF